MLEKQTALTDFGGAIYALKQGKKLARNKIWQLEGYLLKQKLYEVAK